MLKHASQRLKYGISNEDAWSLNTYLAVIIIRGIAELKRQGHSYPPTLTLQEWHKILDQISDGFKAYLLCTDADFQSDEWQTYKEGMELFNQWFPDLWD